MLIGHAEPGRPAQLRCWVRGACPSAPLSTGTLAYTPSHMPWLVSHCSSCLHAACMAITACFLMHMHMHDILCTAADTLALCYKLCCIKLCAHCAYLCTALGHSWAYRRQRIHSIATCVVMMLLLLTYLLVFLLKRFGGLYCTLL